MKYPQIYLALDNCFAIKRWVHPKDWMKMVADIGGIKYIEASTDNEIDPLFNTPGFRREWVGTVKRLEKELDLKICSFFSGYATYRTCGLTHWDKSSRDKIRRAYFENVVDVAEEFGAAVGCALNAFPETVLEDPEEYAIYADILRAGLARMAEYAAKKGVVFCYEQMYSPNLGFWKIDECGDWLHKICPSGQNPMYLTIDTAHQVGQRHYLKPDIKEVLDAMRQSGDSTLWPAIRKRLAAGAYDEKRVEGLLQAFSYLFAEPRDGDLYEWIGELGCYSPVFHLQQTDGTFSAHKPFTAEYNERGIVRPDKLLKALAKSYEKQESRGMPPKAEKIYLAFELFFSMNERPESIKRQLRESIDYWRRYIPEDGLTLDQLITD